MAKIRVTNKKSTVKGSMTKAVYDQALAIIAYLKSFPGVSFPAIQIVQGARNTGYLDGLKEISSTSNTLRYAMTVSQNIACGGKVVRTGYGMYAFLPDNQVEKEAASIATWVTDYAEAARTLIKESAEKLLEASELLKNITKS